MSLNLFRSFLDGNFSSYLSEEFYSNYEYNGDYAIDHKGNNEEGNDKLFFKVWRSLVLRSIIFNINKTFRKQLKINNNRAYRKTKLIIALAKYKIEYRYESRTCNDYIAKRKKGVGNVVKTLCCYKYWFEYCAAKHGSTFKKYQNRYPIPSEWPWMI